MKKIAFIISLILLFTTLTSCGTKTKTTSQEKITLKMVLCGPGKQKDSETVWQAVNEKIKTYDGLENVDLDITVLDTSSYKQKFMLWQTSGEKLDVVQTYGLDYSQLAKDGSFLELDKYIKKSSLSKEFPEYVWDYATVDGKKYYVPTYQVLANVDYSFITPKELADKYLNLEEAQKLMNEQETFNDICWDILEDYLDKLSAAGEIKMGYKPLDSLTHTLQKGYESVGNRFYIRSGDSSHKLIYMDEIPERVASFKRVANLYQKGYIRSDISSVGGSDNMVGAKDGYTVWHGGLRMNETLSKNTLESYKSKYGMEFVGLMTKDYDYIPMGNAAGGMAVSASSDHPDEAFRVIELLNTEEGKDLYRLLAYGIEGVHYNKIDENTIEPIGYTGQPSSSSNYGLYKWNTGNTKYAFATISDSIIGDDIDEINNNEHTVVSSLAGLVLDTSNIEAEIAQINTVFEEYKDLNCGSRPNVDSVYEEYMKKVKEAGLETVREELQKQVDEFFKNKK